MINDTKSRVQNISVCGTFVIFLSDICHCFLFSVVIILPVIVYYNYSKTITKLQRKPEGENI